jgi:hypothetical protein
MARIWLLELLETVDRYSMRAIEVNRIFSNPVDGFPDRGSLII